MCTLAVLAILHLAALLRGRLWRYRGLGLSPASASWLYICIACRYCFCNNGSKEGKLFFEKLYMYALLANLQNCACGYRHALLAKYEASSFAVCLPVEICRLFALWGVFIGCPL